MENGHTQTQHRDQDTTGIQTDRDRDTKGWGHKMTGTQVDRDTSGQGHEWTGTQVDRDTSGQGRK